MADYPGSVGFTPPTNPATPGPAAHAWVVDKSDSVPLPAVTRAIYVGAAGDVTVQLAGVDGGVDGHSNPTLFAAVPAGTTLWICVTYVMSTGTASTNVVALW